MRSRAKDLTLNVRAYALSLVYKSALYTVHTHTYMPSRAEDLTFNVRTYTLGRVCKSALYTIYTLTHTTEPVAVELSCHATALIGGMFKVE